MKITDVIPVLLICQHVSIVYGDLSFFQPNNRPQLQSQQSLDPELKQLDQSLRQRLIPLQQPTPPQQPFSPFQQNLPQQPHLPFQQPFQFHQQPYRPFQQPYSPLQQLYPPLQQQKQYISQLLIQPPICPQPTPICADGRLAMCTRHAVTGFPVYNCPNPILQNGFPWTSGIPGMTPSSSVNSMFRGPNPDNLTGARSLLGMDLGSNTNTVPSSTSDTTNPSMGQGLNADSELGNQGLNPSLSNGPCSNPLCSVCSFLLGSFAPFQPCKPGQLGNPYSSNFPLQPLSQPGYVQPVTSIQLSSTPFQVSALGPAAGLPSADVFPPGYLAAHPYPSPILGSPLTSNYSPDFYSPSYPVQGSYQSPGPISRNEQTLPSLAVSNESKPQDTGPLKMNPEFMNIYPESPLLSDHQQQTNTQLNNPYNPMNQPIRTAPQAHQNQQQFLGGLNYPAFQRTVPLQSAGNPSIFPDLESRQPESPPQLRPFASPGNQPPMSMGYTAISGLSHQNIPTFRGPQSLVAASHTPLMNSLARAEGNLGYQVPEMSASMDHRVQYPLQPGYQRIDQFSSPLGPTMSQHHPRDLQPTSDTKNGNQLNPNFQYLPTSQNYAFGKKPPRKASFFQADNPQNPQNLRGYLSSGLSLLSLLDEEPSHGESSLQSIDKLSSATKSVKKTSNRTRKPSTSSYWL